MYEDTSKLSRQNITELQDIVFLAIKPALAIQIISMIIKANKKPITEFDFEERYGVV